MASYGPYLVDVPALDDSDLIYSIDETKAIFKFFYPDMSSAIDGAAINDLGRAYAQTLMIAAIDGSYAMSYVDDLFTVLSDILKSGKNPGILSLAKKLGKKFVKTWWKHVRSGSQLEQAKIYVTVRISIANAMSTMVRGYISNPDSASNGLPNGFRTFIQAVA
jgi:hypothetical protein